MSLVKRKKIALVCEDVSEEVQKNLWLIAISTKLGNVDLDNIIISSFSLGYKHCFFQHFVIHSRWKA